MAIALGATPGAISRFWVIKIAQQWFGDRYYGTFFVNVLGCLVIAWVMTATEARFKHWAREVRLVVATGFCGAFTTFSTFGLEIATWLQQGKIELALGYSVVSTIAGLVGILLGVAMAKWGLAQEPME
jgi:CrcB protein